MGLDRFVGQVLDEKYQLERLLGQGGMGAVYLATHLGTERYVALKLITPQLMRNDEFVQRFQREARAAGRLRHPNVVDVTDFGFASAGEESLAYLVMEYLDGCTLADVLKEEKKLPLEWVVDILEQVCSAVHEAHQQGIVHRDLKPENIWLEPNRLGGYRVKVLDFGIAKLASGDSPMQAVETLSIREEANVVQRILAAPADPASSVPNLEVLENETLLYTKSEPNEVHAVRKVQAGTDTPSLSGPENTQLLTPAPTRSQPGDSLAELAQPNPSQDIDNDASLALSVEQANGQSNSDSPGATVSVAKTMSTQLTRAGAIMGTPVYMSPEQCAAKNLDARSDIYSLGVIAYQMLAGEPPFKGNTARIMREHMEAEPPPLRARVKKVPKRVEQIVMASLSKDPVDRPQTAAAFASSLRAQAEGIGALYRRAFALYSEYFPKFVRLSLIAHIPVIFMTLVLIGLDLAANAQPKGWGLARVLLMVALVIASLVQIISYFVAASVISGTTAVIVTQLSLAPLRPVELRKAFAALKRRWRPFLKTAISVTLRIIIGFVLLVIPGIIMSVRYSLYAPVVLIEGLEKKAALRRSRELAARSWRTAIIVTMLQFAIPMTVNIFLGRVIVIRGDLHKKSLSHQIYQQASGLINIFIVPLMSIVPALLYLKMRQLGGEQLTSALDQIEAMDAEGSHWQQRMRTRLSLHPSRSTPGSHK